MARNKLGEPSSICMRKKDLPRSKWKVSSHKERLISNQTELFIATRFVLEKLGTS